ncbi:FliA/WhiG family RNA polymerase sigma factor [Planctomycetota bacterium]|nr:FliA/WhiG family RNA polymerase sigma factor [Planctomycetota bacterium]
MARIRSRSRSASRKPSPEAEKRIKEVWLIYKNDGPTELLRNELMEHYLPLVKYNAERIHAKLPDEVDVEDLMSAGIFGLMDAIDAFDLSRGVKFETYCAPRIRGAILDELRSMDWVPRLVRSRSSQVDQARKRIEMSTGQKPTDDELRDELGVDKDEYEKIRRDAGAVGVVSLSRKWFETDSNKDVREIDVLKDQRQINPLTAVQKRDLKDMITKGLTRAERLIVVLYYYEEMTMKEIGVTLDLSESRVSQMHSSILARLKAQLQHRSTELQTESA